MLQALLAGPEDAAEYGEDVIDAGNRVLPDLILDEPGTHLFVLTTTRVSEVLSRPPPRFSSLGGLHLLEVD